MGDLQRVEDGRRVRNLVAVIGRVMQKRSQYKLGAIGLTIGGYDLLSAIGDEEKMTTTDAKKILQVDHSTISTLLVRLEKSGIVERRRSPDDKRAAFIVATEHGKELRQRADEIMKLEYIDLTHRFSPDDLTHLVRLLEKARANVVDDDA